MNDALPAGVSVTMGGAGAGNAPYGYWELNGHAQTVGKLTGAATNGDNTIIYNSSGTLSTLTVNQSANSTYGGLLNDNLALVKSGAGTLTLTNNHSTYTGGTSITAGTLALSTAGTLGGGDISVGAGAKLNLSGLNATFALSGNQVLSNRGTVVGGLLIGANTRVTGGGSFSGSVTNQSGGTLTPGVGGDTNYFADLTLNGDSTNIFWLGSATTHDMSVVTNSLNYGGATATDAPVLQLDLSSWTQGANVGQLVVLYDNEAGVTAWDGTNKLFRLSDATGLFDGMLLTNGMVFTVSGSGAGTFKINYDLEGTGGAGNNILLTVIPEPASLNLLAMLGVAYFVRRRLHRKRGRWNV